MVSCSLYPCNAMTAVAIFLIFLYQAKWQDFCDVAEGRGAPHIIRVIAVA
jgi:hypothetical protein